MLQLEDVLIIGRRSSNNHILRRGFRFVKNHRRVSRRDVVCVDRNVLFRGKRRVGERVVGFWIEMSIKIEFGMVFVQRIRVKCKSTCYGNLDRGFELRVLIL